MKTRLAEHFFTGKKVRDLESLAEEFLSRHLMEIINREVLSRLQKHVDDGDEVYLVSANFDFVLAPLIPRWKLKGVIATRTESVDGVLTGKLIGRACEGREKRDRVIELVGSERIKGAVAYGDSAGDLCLLDSVGEAHLVERKKYRQWLHIARFCRRIRKSASL
jgi:HAD superfamily hydrolase (TIGR01490 family)